MQRNGTVTGWSVAWAAEAFETMAAKRYLLPLLLMVVLCRHAWLGNHAHPHTDDWSYGTIGREAPLLERLSTEYRAWNGRWASNVLVLRGPMVLELPIALRVYQTIPAVLLVLTILAWWMLFRASCFHAVIRERAGSIALALTALYLNLVPDPGGALHWYTGAVTYHLPLVLFAIHLTTLTFRSRWWRLVGGMPMAWAMGSNEVVMLLVLAFHACRTVLMRRGAGQWSREGLAWLALAAGLAAIMVMAPGNAARASLFPERHQFWYSMGFTLAQTFRFGAGWVVSPALLVASVLFVYLVPSHVRLFKWSHHLPPVAWSLVIILAVMICFFPAYWSTGMLGQHRTANVGLFAFLLLWFTMLDGWRHRLRSLPHHPRLLRASRSNLVLGLAVGVSLLFTRNDLHLTLDLLQGEAAAFDHRMTHAYQEIEAAVQRHESTVHVAVMVQAPASLNHIPLSEERDAWPNLAMATWFGGRGFSIVVDRPSKSP